MLSINSRHAHRSRCTRRPSTGREKKDHDSSEARPLVTPSPLWSSFAIVESQILIDTN